MNIKLGFVLLLTLILRIYPFPYRYELDPDSLRDALVAAGGAESFLFPMTGPFSSIGPFTFGPWYFYQIILADILIPFQYAPWILMTIVSFLFVFIMYKTGEVLVDKKFGLLIAFLSAISPAQIGTASHLSNLHTVPFFAALFLFILCRNLKSKISLRWFFVSGVALGISINSHYQAGGLFLFPLLFLFFRLINLLQTGTIFAGVFTSFMPLLIFNLTHDFVTVRGVLDTLLHFRKMIYVANSWKIYIQFLSLLWSSVVGVPKIVGVILAVIVGGVSFWQFQKKKISKQILIIFIVFLVNIFMLRYYWAVRHDVYFLFLHPLLFTILGYGIYKLSSFRYGIFGSLVIVGIISFYALKDDSRHLKASKSTVLINQQVNMLTSTFPGKKFVLFKCIKTPINVTASEALLLVLHQRKLISHDGIRIGMYDNNCISSPEEGKSDLAMVPGTKIIQVDKLDEKNDIDRSWKKIEPTMYYDQVANWWKK